MAFDKVADISEIVRVMFRLFGLLLVGLVLAGCQTTTEKSRFTTSNFKLSTTASKNIEPFPEERTKQKVWLKYYGYEDNWEVQSTVQTILASSDVEVCTVSVTSLFHKLATAEAKRRGLNCDVGDLKIMQAKLQQFTELIIKPEDVVKSTDW